MLALRGRVALSLKKYLAVFVLISLVACLAVGFFAYQQGVGANISDDKYGVGYEAGKAIGDSEGYTKGYNTGASSAYASGYHDGLGNASVSVKPIPTQTAAPVSDRYDEGYNAGLSSGKSQGYADGYSKGTGDGFSSGFNVGYVNGSKDGAGSGYNIRDPTYNEMQVFLVSDKTNENLYNDSYTCYEFTHDVLENAFSQGLKAGYVYIEFETCAHAIVCFDTVDKGLVFVEPQSDDVVTVALGVHYWDRAIYEEPSYDDTIVKFDIIW